MAFYTLLYSRTVDFQCTTFEQQKTDANLSLIIYRDKVNYTPSIVDLYIFFSFLKLQCFSSTNCFSLRSVHNFHYCDFLIEHKKKSRANEFTGGHGIIVVFGKLLETVVRWHYCLYEKGSTWTGTRFRSNLGFFADRIRSHLVDPLSYWKYYSDDKNR